MLGMQWRGHKRTGRGYERLVKWIKRVASGVCRERLRLP
jgi:hypothetical protein